MVFLTREGVVKQIENNVLEWGILMKKNKLIAWLLVLTMVATLVAGCGKKGDDKKTEDANSDVKTEETATPETEVTEGPEAAMSTDPITLKFYSADSVGDEWSDPVAQKITELTGVTIETDYPVGGDTERIALMIASQDYPDIIFAKGDTNQLVDAGALIDLTDLIDQYGSNIKKLFGDNLSRLKYSQEDEAIYTLGAYGVDAEKYAANGAMQLQFAVLKELGYPVIKTLEEYEEAIKTYKEKYPTIDGQETIGMSLIASDWRWYITLSNPSGFASGSPDNGQWIVNDDTLDAVYKHTADGQKEYYKWLNHMNDIGLLDPESFTQTWEDYVAKIATGRVLGIADAIWDYADANASLLAEGKADRTYCGLPVTLNENIKSADMLNQGYSGGWGIGITKDCKDPVRVIQFLDWMCSDEAQILTHWGIEGVNYLIDDNGKRYRSEEEIKYSKEDPDYKKKTGVGFHTYPFPEYGDGRTDANGDYYTTITKQTTIDTYNEEQLAACKAWGVEMLTDIFPQTDEFPVSPYGAVWQTSVPSDSDLNEIITKADEISQKTLPQLVLCSPDEFDAKWDQFQKDLVGAGIEDANTEMSQLIKDTAAFWAN